MSDLVTNTSNGGGLHPFILRTHEAQSQPISFPFKTHLSSHLCVCEAGHFLKGEDGIHTKG